MMPPDGLLVAMLERRDGPLPLGQAPHRRPGGGCPYRGLLADRPCPWCAAQDRREARKFCLGGCGREAEVMALPPRPGLSWTSGWRLLCAECRQAAGVL